MLAMNPRIALQIEKNRAHGRAMLKGIADYALEHTEWQLELVDPCKITDDGYLAQFDGLIVRVMDDAAAEALIKSKKPVVDTYGRIDDNPLQSIRLDDAAIAKLAFACFSEHHFRMFAYCGFEGLRFSDERGAVFGKLVETAGFDCKVFSGRRSARISDTFFRDEKTDVPDAVSVGKWLRSLPKPIGIFCCNDLRAVQVLKVCAALGVSVPSEVSVIGVDDDVLLCTFAKPSLSSIETDSFALGRKAAEMLNAQLSAGNGKMRRASGSVLHRPRRVVERMSTNVYPFRTPWLPDAIMYIRKHLADGVTADDVVRHIGYSHPTVTKAFVEELGHAVKKEIQLQRIRLACSMLKQTDLSAVEISALCGYRSPQYFSHCFAEEFQVTPDVWRKR